MQMYGKKSKREVQDMLRNKAYYEVGKISKIWAAG